MPTLLHDKLRLNHNLLLSLPFREMTGQQVWDRALAHHPIVGHNLTWTTGMPVIPSTLGLAVFDGASAYADGANADTLDMDFMAGDYTIAGWINWTDTALSEMIIARYQLDVSGWELYLWDSVLQLRHHHAAGATARTGAYSYNWTPGMWWLFGISRSGAYPLHYRNGVAVEVGYSVGGMIDPETCAQDLVIGCRWTKDSDWYSGYQALLRVWDRELEEWEHRQIYEMERHWFAS